MRLPNQTSLAFDALIDDHFAQREEGEAPSVRPGLSIDGLEAAWEINARSAHFRDQTIKPGYGAEDIARDLSLEPQRILAELGLGAHATEAEVLALRRHYALRNHPDRLPAPLHSLATQRMMIVNDILDRYLARLRQNSENR